VRGEIPITEGITALHFASDLAVGDTAVVYSNAEGAKFLREKSNFLAVLGKPTSQYCRFEEVVA
jgi:hypothetical protein